MSIFWIDNRESKQDCIDALVRYREHRDFDRAMLDMEVSLDNIRINKTKFMSFVSKLVMANNVDRAIKLVHAIPDSEPRLWWKLPILLALWPFLLIWRIIKLGLPGD